MANPRTGAAKGQRGRPGQAAWRDDPLIQERVNLVRTLRAQGYTASMMLAPVNELMRRRGVPEVGLDTVYSDFARIRELLDEERAEAAGAEEDARQRHIESLEEVKRQAWRAFHSAGAASLNRSAYLNTIRATEEAIGKYDGSLAEHHVVSGPGGTAIQIDDARERLAGELGRLADRQRAAEAPGSTDAD